MDIKTSALRVVGSFLKSAESQLEMGKKVEKEHQDVYDYFEKFLKKHDLEMPLSRDELYKMISEAHLKEDSAYYTKLEKIDPHHKEAMDFTSISYMITPNKKLNDRELTRVLRLSQAAELDAVHLYELIADATGNATVKKVTQDIANEEKVHVSEFGSLINDLDKENEGFIEEGKKEVEDLKK